MRPSLPQRAKWVSSLSDWVPTWPSTGRRFKRYRAFENGVERLSDRHIFTYDICMKRTSLFLDTKILNALKRAAQRRQVSVASLVREALVRYLAEPASGARLPSVTGRFSSGMSDTAERADEMLWRDPHA